MIMKMKRVILESPYAGDIQANLQFARDCVRACAIDYGEAALGSHLLWPQALDDAIASERALGISCGNAWRAVADYTVFYTDRGWSQGMIDALALCLREGRTFCIRGLSISPKWPPRIDELSRGDQSVINAATWPKRAT